MSQKHSMKRLMMVSLTGISLAISPATLLYGAGHKAQQAAPIKLGTSGSSVRDKTAKVCCTGTLGSLVTDSSGKKYILSNNHVLADSNNGMAGDAIYQRGFGDTKPTCSGNGQITVAHLTKFIPLNFGTGTNSVDAAIAEVVAGQVSPTGEILEIGAVSSATGTAKVGATVKKSGRTTGLTSGTVKGLHSKVQIRYGACGQAETQTATFTEQVLITPGTFSNSGDSGSLIVQTGSGKPIPVALLFAGSTAATIGNPISAVLSALNIKMAAGPATAQEIAEASAPPEPDLEAAAVVKDKYDTFLFTLPEVVGHGVGRDNSGRAAILLYLRQATPLARQAAPESLDGVPVVLMETGEFRSVPNCSGAAPEKKGKK